MHPFALPERVPTPRNVRFRRALTTLDRVAYRIIAQRLRADGDADDLLAMMLHARDDETGARMTVEHLRDEIMTLLLAGHETTALALTWTWYLLAQHPAVEHQVHTELDAVLDGRTPRVEDLPRLPYTKMVLDEVLRLYPPAWALVRQAVAADEIAGYRIPAGAPVAMSPYVTHRHPTFWERPAAFAPERFAPEHATARPAFAYFPFGGGPRQCIGSHFALMEAQLIVATIAQRYRLRLVPGQVIRPLPQVTLRPERSIAMTLVARHAGT